jgi:hypothetical protein
MPRIQLRVTRHPDQAEVFLNIKDTSGGYLRQAAIVDTGAQVSLLPEQLMALLDARLVGGERVLLIRAGMESLTFEAVEAVITVFLEDEHGNQTEPFECPVWFAATLDVLAGFGGLLDRAILHLDMPNLTGYLELAP